MFFCEKCRYLYNVTKDIKNKQHGGRVSRSLENIFSKYNNNEKLEKEDIRKLKKKDILDDERFENITKKEQRRIMSQIKALDKNFFSKDNDEEPKIGSNIAYFICKYCRHSKQIKPGTIIYSKSYSNDGSMEIEDYTYAIYDQTLPRTRNYICKNPDCESHKNSSDKEAVLTKNATDQIVYICTMCSSNWVNIV